MLLKMAQTTIFLPWIVLQLQSSLATEVPSNTPVQPLGSSSPPVQQQAVTEVVSSFSQITQTYSYITQSFQNTSQALSSQQYSIEETRSTLVQFQSNLSQVVQGISGGCQCGADGVDTTHLQSMVTTWFVNLQYMVRVVQIRHPNDYQTTFSEIFVKISFHMQISLGVAYSAGVNVDKLCQNAIDRGGINPAILSKVNIQTDRFTRISQAVTTHAGVFSRIPAPIGHRFPGRKPSKNSILRPPSWGIKLPQPIFDDDDGNGNQNPFSSWDNQNPFASSSSSFDPFASTTSSDPSNQFFNSWNNPTPPPSNLFGSFDRFWNNFWGFPFNGFGRPDFGAQDGQPAQ